MAPGLPLRRYELRPDPGHRLRVAERQTLMPNGLRLHLDRRAAVVRTPAPVEVASSLARCPVTGTRD
ncbi:hypothetical protein GCM10022206_21770 [Streptomyces chiangmaiensis]